MHYLPIIYFVKQPLHVSSVLTAHHQEVFILYVQQLVRVIHLGDGQPVGTFYLTQPGASRGCLTK
jgi:hypothetical protein